MTVSDVPSLPRALRRRAPNRSGRTAPEHKIREAPQARHRNSLPRRPTGPELLSGADGSRVPRNAGPARGDHCSPGPGPRRGEVLARAGR
ncbi:hypothetical protein Ae168Ps1_4767c [Pseudonocardia sp. Ae168_Ps1]|nr:hypothetical protein Ae150APs1_4730c [Pseudonocardia sp. Ae150A_Ps1]OLL82361.1 hypothetical protein Ae168Ps1_4767c [Pseudonocardia sp. Ae168_Ps1]OLL83522.1 hypothetical protein Ae263Ps1_0577 [Pseudonocardia sp. Ae263_Ps1]OLL90439.1 hypothetical protein Ae356Ps1_0336c [Pseudonocardia sp. Ae356_Ps1]